MLLAPPLYPHIAAVMQQQLSILSPKCETDGLRHNTKKIQEIEIGQKQDQRKELDTNLNTQYIWNFRFLARHNSRAGRTMQSKIILKSNYNLILNPGCWDKFCFYKRTQGIRLAVITSSVSHLIPILFQCCLFVTEVTQFCVHGGPRREKLCQSPIDQNESQQHLGGVLRLVTHPRLNVA